MIHASFIAIIDPNNEIITWYDWRKKHSNLFNSKDIIIIKCVGENMFLEPFTKTYIVPFQDYYKGNGVVITTSNENCLSEVNSVDIVNFFKNNKFEKDEYFSSKKTALKFKKDFYRFYLEGKKDLKEKVHGIQRILKKYDVNAKV